MLRIPERSSGIQIISKHSVCVVCVCVHVQISENKNNYYIFNKIKQNKICHSEETKWKKVDTMKAMYTKNLE